MTIFLIAIASIINVFPKSFVVPTVTLAPEVKLIISLNLFSFAFAVGARGQKILVVSVGIESQYIEPMEKSERN